MQTDRRSDAGRLEDFVRAHQRTVWRSLRVLGCEPAEADDLTQDVFVAALQAPVATLPEEHARGYLLRAAKHAFLKSLRRAEVRARIDDLQRAEPFRVGPDSDRLVDALRACLEQLDARTRRILDGRYRDESRAAEIAGELGITEAHVNTIVHRAKITLRRCIEGKTGSEEPR